MQFETPLVQATLLQRYKRFLADVTLENSKDIVTVHCPNTGSMKTCGSHGDTVYLAHSKQETRKYPYTWELTKLPANDGFVGINTQRPNQIVGEALREKRIPELSSYSTIQPEAKYGNSRFDFLLTGDDGKKCWVEVKNVTLRDGEFLLFPDAKTERGAKHLEQLMSLVKFGDRCVMFYLINRSDGRLFDCAQSIDPRYYELYKQAKTEGVEVLAYRSKITIDSISLGERILIS